MANKFFSERTQNSKLNVYRHGRAHVFEVNNAKYITISYVFIYSTFPDSSDNHGSSDMRSAAYHAAICIDNELYQ